MRIITGIIFFVLATPAFVSSSRTIPPLLVGKWVIGAPYDTPGPVGIDADQEEFIRTLHINYVIGHYHVCGKDISIKSISKKSLTDDEFLRAYGFLSRVIGMKSLPIIDITINPPGGMSVCGEYENPGSHVLIDSSGHVVIEVANDYFSLEKE